MSTDAIVLLKNDHKEIRKLFRDFRGAGPRAEVKKGRIVEQDHRSPDGSHLYRERGHVPEGA